MIGTFRVAWHTARVVTQQPESDREFYDATMGKQGRVVLPAPIRERLGLVEGDRLVAYIDEDDRLVLLPREALRRALRRSFGHVPADVDVVQELIDERRAEAAREAGER